MKEKWIELTRPQRVMLLLQGALVLVFLILYATLGQQLVISYRNTAFSHHSKGEIDVYSGKVDGQKAVFTVSPGPVVEYRLGDTLYGPYTITMDQTAVPQGDNYLTGVEIRKDGQIWFRGGYICSKVTVLVVAEDGTSLIFGFEDSAGPEPDARAVLTAALELRAVHRGNWAIFLTSALCCVGADALILFADSMFRHKLRYLIRDPERAEPSDWELISRWLLWTLLTVAALVSFIFGLTAPDLF